MRDLRLADRALTQRFVTLIFVWSRMRVVDEASAKERARLLQLSFEDFLEASAHP